MNLMHIYRYRQLIPCNGVCIRINPRYQIFISSCQEKMGLKSQRFDHLDSHLYCEGVFITRSRIAMQIFCSDA